MRRFFLVLKISNAFDENFGADFLLNTLSDRDYQRDYHFNYSAYSTSKVNFDYIKGRDYFSIKSITFS